MTEHNGNDRGPRRGERPSFNSSRGPRDSQGKAPRQGGGRPAKTGQDRDGQSRGPWKERGSFNSSSDERRGRPDSATSGRPNREGDRFPRRDDRSASPRRNEGGRDGERGSSWKPRDADSGRGAGQERQERRPFNRDSNGYGRPSNDNRSGNDNRRGEDRRSDDRRSSAPRGERPSQRSERSDSWQPRTPGQRPGGERSFNRDANSYRRPDGDDRRTGAPRSDRTGAPRTDRAGAPRGDRRDSPRPDRRNDSPRYDSSARAERAPRSERPERSSDAPARIHNPRDLRSANRPDRERSPEIDEGVTGAELDRVTRAQLRTLESKNGEWVAKHLVMAGRLIDDDPELSFQHALAASRRGGRLAAVREAVGLTAYAAGHYAEALREFRTYRRISGSNVHLPLMADSERGLGRADRALDLARSEEVSELDSAGQVEMAIVVSGARADLGQKEAALAALEITQLDKNRAFSYSPRLFRAYADALEAMDRAEEANSWRAQARLADEALGTNEDDEPEIIDLIDDEDEEPDTEAKPTVE